MPRKSDRHDWRYEELPPVPPTEGARPAQRCARCGLVRRFAETWWWYQNGEYWREYDTEPPCEAAETPAKPILAP